MMMEDKGDKALPCGTGPSQAEPVVSALRASVPSADESRQLVECLARYLDPQAFNRQRRSKRNSDAAFRARKLAMKQARAAIRFMIKPGNIERLLLTRETKDASAIKETGE